MEIDCYFDMLAKCWNLFQVIVNLWIVLFLFRRYNCLSLVSFLSFQPVLVIVLHPCLTKFPVDCSFSGDPYKYNMLPPLPAQRNLTPPPTLYPQQPVSVSENYNLPKFVLNNSSEISNATRSRRSDINVWSQLFFGFILSQRRMYFFFLAWIKCCWYKLKKFHLLSWWLTLETATLDSFISTRPLIVSGSLCTRFGLECIMIDLFNPILRAILLTKHLNYFFKW